MIADKRADQGLDFRRPDIPELQQSGLKATELPPDFALAPSKVQSENPHGTDDGSSTWRAIARLLEMLDFPQSRDSQVHG